MKFIFRKISSVTQNFAVFFVIANLLLLASNIPLILRYLNTPSGMIFNFSHTFWDHDYNLYLSAIMQGKHGFALYHDAVTSEPTTSGIFYIFYTYLGKITSIFDFSAALSYHLARIFSIELFFLLLWVLSQTLLGKKFGFLGSILAVTAGISPPVLFKEQLNISLAIPWWTNFDALERLNALPHYVVAYDFLLLTIILMIYFFRSKKMNYAFTAGMLILTGGIVFPAVLIPIGAALPLTIVFLMFKKLDKVRIFGAFIIVLFAIAALLAVKWQELQGFPWNENFSVWQINRWNYHEPNFNYDLFFIFGLLPLLAIPALMKNLLTDNPEFIFISFWAISAFVLLPFVNILQIPKLRLVEDSHFIPFALLGAQSISLIIFKFNRKIIKMGIILFLAGFTVPVSIILFDWRLSFLRQNFLSGVFYYSADELSGMRFIEKNIPKNSVIISTTAHIIPAYSPVISYWGHLALTKNFPLKRENTISFFSAKMDRAAAREFLKSNRINYVYVGPEEKKFGFNPLFYSFLKPVYADEYTSIYRVES